MTSDIYEKMFLTEDIKKLLRSAVILHEANERDKGASSLLEQSLASGRMSGFLFEADTDKAVEQSLDDAIEAATTVLTSLEEAGKNFPSQAIGDAISGLRDKLTKVAMTKKSGGLGINDLLGRTSGEISFIAQSLTNINSTILKVVTDVSGMLKAANLDATKIGDKSLKTLIKEKQLTAFKNEAELQKAVKDIVSGGVRGKAKGILATIAGFFKGAKPVNLDVDQFAIEVMDAKISAMVEWTKSPSGQAAQDPQSFDKATGGEVQQAIKDSGVTPKELEAASKEGDGGSSPPASGGKKLKKDAAKTGLLNAVKDAAGNKAPAVVDAILGSADLAELFEEGVRSKPLHRRRLSSLLFEKVGFDQVVKVVQGAGFEGDDAKTVAVAAAKYLKSQDLEVDVPDEGPGEDKDEKASEDSGEVTDVVNQATSEPLGKSIKAFFDAISSGASDDGKEIATKLQNDAIDAYKQGATGLLDQVKTVIDGVQGQAAEMVFGNEEKASAAAEALEKIFQDNLKLEALRRNERLRQEINRQSDRLIETRRWAQLAGLKENKRR